MLGPFIAGVAGFGSAGHGSVVEAVLLALVGAGPAAGPDGEAGDARVAGAALEAGERATGDFAVVGVQGAGLRSAGDDSRNTGHDPVTSS